MEVNGSVRWLHTDALVQQLQVVMLKLVCVQIDRWEYSIYRTIFVVVPHIDYNAEMIRWVFLAIHCADQIPFGVTDFVDDRIVVKLKCMQIKKIYHLSSAKRFNSARKHTDWTSISLQTTIVIVHI